MEIEVYKHGIKYRLQKLRFHGEAKHRVRWRGLTLEYYDTHRPSAQRQRWKLVHVASGTWVDSNARLSSLLRSRVWANHAAQEFLRGIRRDGI